MEVVDGEMIPLMMILTTLALLVSKTVISIDVATYPKLLEWLKERKDRNIPDLQAKYINQDLGTPDSEQPVSSARAKPNPRSLVAEEAFGEIIDRVPHARSLALNPFEIAIAAKHTATVSGRYMDMDVLCRSRDLVAGIKKIAEFKVYCPGESSVAPGAKNLGLPATTKALGYTLSDFHPDDHIQKAFSRLKAAVYAHNEATGSHPYTDSSLNLRKASQALGARNVSELLDPSVIKDFEYMLTPSTNSDKFDWRESAGKLRKLADSVSECCEASAHVSKVQVQIAANDLKVTVDAYMNRLLTKRETPRQKRNAISMIALALPVYIKQATCEVITWVHGSSSDYTDFQKTMQTVLLDYVEDFECRHGAIEPGDRARAAKGFFQRFLDAADNTETRTANVNRIAMARFKAAADEIGRRSDEIERLAGLASGVICEIFISVT